MKLWTVQPSNVWDIWQENGTIAHLGRDVDPDFADAYIWIADQMKEKIGYPQDDIASPIWAWQQWDGVRRMKPDLRHSMFLMPGDKGVRIALDVPECNVVLSDYNLWHSVLNNDYLGANGKDYDRFVAEHLYGQYVPSSVDLSAQKHIEKSWERVFDLETIDDFFQPMPKQFRSIQATFWSAPISWVQDVTYFTAR